MIEIPAAAAAALIECAGKVLRVPLGDVESVDFNDRRDVIEVPGNGTSVSRELGPQRVTIVINMKPGACAHWVDKK